MAKIIAVAGKGGVGKTTLTGLIIQYLCENGKTPILAVDADANSNLNEVLGVEAPPTLGEIREEIERAGMALHSPIPAGMAKGDYLQMRLEDAITEEKDFDLMVMGRTQGQGCYCFVNGLVQTQIQRLQANYPWADPTERLCITAGGCLIHPAGEAAAVGDPPFSGPAGFRRCRHSGTRGTNCSAFRTGRYRPPDYSNQHHL